MCAEPTAYLKTFFGMLVRSIAGFPDAVDVIERRQNEEVLLTVIVAEEDFDRFSENGGRTLRALDTVLSAMSKRDRFNATLEVVARSLATRVN